MGKGAALRWIENKRLGRHLSGRGIEIGALWRKFPVTPRAVVWYVDRNQPSALRREYPELGCEIISADVLADAAQLPFADGSLNFVIASHVLEHMPFPLAALRGWYRVLGSGGVLILKIPDKRYTFDMRRARTPLQHLIDEDLHPEVFDKRAHFLDWVEHVGERARASEALERETDRLIDLDYSIHYHVWTDQDIREVIDYTRRSMGLNWRRVLFLRARFYRKECAVVLRRG
jgi:predicted SAM-dependent methyltransferase